MMPWFTAWSSSAFGQGLLSNVLNLDHICFALMTGSMLFHFLQKRRLLAAALAGNAFGIALGASFGKIPGAQLLVGFSLILLIAIICAPERFQRGLVFTLGGIGILHGILHADRHGQFLSASNLSYYIGGVVLAIAILAIAFHSLLKFLEQRPKNLRGEVEHILIAVASGSALAYIILSF